MLTIDVAYLVYRMGYCDAMQGKVYRDSLEPTSSLRQHLDSYDEGWTVGREQKLNQKVMWC